ncbi:MAG: hypothetical protein K2I81_04235 [Alphaproteobacteria bacterium]|nr:hypothetical protein [Alphaproteobacteria bacterium]
MKKNLTCIALTFVIMPYTATGLTIPGFGTCNPNGGTCPSDGIYTNGKVYGHCTNGTTCECYNTDETGTPSITVQCECTDEGNYETIGYGCLNGIYQKCKSCSGSSGAWGTHSTGYEKRSVTTCSCDGTKSTRIEYRCAKGYFGTSTNGTSGCSQCFPPATTSSAGKTQGTDCYIPAGTNMSDSSGIFTCSTDTYYSNK